MSKGGRQNICCSVLLSNVTMSLKEAVADPIWVQSTIAKGYIVYMGTNSNNTQCIDIIVYNLQLKS